jgi:hypothetical protein
VPSLCKFFFCNTERHSEYTEYHRVFYCLILKIMIVPNLLLIAGTGTNSGKTSLACRIIESHPDLRITAIKITPHFHETTSGLVEISKQEGFVVYEETNRDSSKDTSRMIRAGAVKVYLAKAQDNKVFEAFNEIMKEIPEGTPVICESPALRNFVEPGVFIIMTSNTIDKHKDIKHLQALPHLTITLEELEKHKNIPVEFEHGRWINKA